MPLLAFLTFDFTSIYIVLFILLVVNPIAYYFLVNAYRYRVNRAMPITRSQTVKLAAARIGMGMVFVGGGTWVSLVVGDPFGVLLCYIVVARITIWWVVGKHMLILSSKRLFGWIVAGMIIDTAFDVMINREFLIKSDNYYHGVLLTLPVVVPVAIFVYFINRRGKRPELVEQFDPSQFCQTCKYNLTGNLTGICPECGTPISIEFATIPPEN